MEKWYFKNNSEEVIINKYSENVLDSTLIHLTERFSNSELFIVGTMNSSNVLANRTRSLIRDLKPDVVFVQANEKF